MKIDLTDTTASKINKALVKGRRAIGTNAGRGTGTGGPGLFTTASGCGIGALAVGLRAASNSASISFVLW